MYFCNILQKSESEIVKQVFLALKEFPGRKKDQLQQVYEDLEFCNIKHNEEEIMGMSKLKFKKIVDSKIKIIASEYLTKLQMSHSKSRYLYQEPEIKDYLTTDQLSTKEKKLLFKLRSRTTPNKTNYKMKYINDLSCSLCEDKATEESEIHFLECQFLVNVPQLGQELHTIKYEDIFGNLSYQIKAMKVWTKIFKIYEAETSTKN